MRVLGSAHEKESLGSGGRGVARLPRLAGRNRSRSWASRTGDYACQSVVWSVSEGDIVDRVGMELEVRNTGIEMFPIHQSGLLLEERNLDSRNRRRSVWQDGIERSPSLEFQVCLTLCISCGPPGATLASISIRGSLGAFGIQIGPLRWHCSQGRVRADPPAACAC